MSGPASNIIKTVNISVSNLYVLMGRNYFKRFDKVLSDVWRSYDRDDYNKWLTNIKKEGIIPSTMSPSQQLVELQKKHNINIMDDVKKCQKSRCAKEMANTQQQILTTISRQVHTDAKEQIQKLVKDATNTVYGTHQEGGAIKAFEQQSGKVVSGGQRLFKHSLGIHHNIEWFIVGKIDGETSDGEIVEIKNRTNKLFGSLRLYEEPQIMIYMFLANTKNGYLVENLKKKDNCKLGIIPVLYQTNYFESQVIPSVVRFQKFFVDFIGNNDLKRYLLTGNEDLLYQAFMSY